MADKVAIGLAEFCEQVKRELLTPEAQGRSRIPLLSVEEVVLELHVGVEREASGGLNIQVFKIGGGGKVEETHKVTVTLKPLLSLEERLKAFKERDRDGWSRLSEQSVALLKGDSTGLQDEFSK